jgi:hypothetical protein
LVRFVGSQACEILTSYYIAAIITLLLQVGIPFTWLYAGVALAEKIKKVGDPVVLVISSAFQMVLLLVLTLFWNVTAVIPIVDKEISIVIWIVVILCGITSLPAMAALNAFSVDFNPIYIASAYFGLAFGPLIVTMLTVVQLAGTVEPRFSVSTYFFLSFLTSVPCFVCLSIAAIPAVQNFIRSADPPNPHESILEKALTDLRLKVFPFSRDPIGASSAPSDADLGGESSRTRSASEPFLPSNELRQLDTRAEQLGLDAGGDSGVDAPVVEKAGPGADDDGETSKWKTFMYIWTFVRVPLNYSLFTFLFFFLQGSQPFLAPSKAYEETVLFILSIGSAITGQLGALIATVPFLRLKLLEAWNIAQIVMFAYLMLAAFFNETALFTALLPLTLGIFCIYVGLYAYFQPVAVTVVQHTLPTKWVNAEGRVLTICNQLVALIASILSTIAAVFDIYNYTPAAPLPGFGGFVHPFVPRMRPRMG